jgi:hypothetical protein
MRAPLDVPKGESSITLSGLQPGNIYTVKASRAAEGQSVKLALIPPTMTAAPVSVLPNGKNGLRFTATSDRVTFNIVATTGQIVSSVPMFLSVHCETCVDEAAKKKSWLAESLTNLQVFPNVTAQSLITNTLIGGDCFTVTNVTSQGNPLARGTFSNGSTNIGIGSGMVLSTGNIGILPGPNSQGNANGGFGDSGFDPDLASLVAGDLGDITIIEFDFTPTANTVQFDFVFGSEEYCEYVGTEFNDVFGFFISGPGIPGVKNLAVIPGTGGIPVTINNVNHASNTEYYVNNNLNLFQCAFLPADHLQECELDGWTTPLTALATVIPCATYHIKLAIADVTDELFDSAVFFRANSFNAGGTVSASPAYQEDLESAYEGCAQGAVRFTRGNGDVSQPLTVNFTVSAASTATAGVDYTPLVGPVIIPAGQSAISLPVNVLSDGITEGPETIRLLIDNSCQCQQAEVVFLINDNLVFTTTVVLDTTICEGTFATLTATTDDGIAPYSYAWNTGDTSQAILVSPLIATIYTVTVTDACGATATDEAVVEVVPIFRNTINVVLCPGGSINIGGVVYTDAGMVSDTSYETLFCGRITTYVITLSDPAQGNELIKFCAGESVEIGGNLYTESGTVVDTVSTAAGCDSVVTYTLEVLPLSFGTATIAFCPGDSVSIGGNFYNQSGTVLDTLTAVSGCDSVITYTLEVLPLSFGTAILTFCPGDSVSVGGNFYNQSGTVLDTLTAVSGCDSIVTYTLIQLPQPTRTEVISFCPGESVLLGGVTYTQPTTVTLTLPGTLGCDTVVTYKLELLPEPTRAETIKFCIGESVTLGGVVYTQPGTVVLTAPASVGCDTIVTYTLEYRTPAPSTVTINCPPSLFLNVSSGANSAVGTYHAASASSDCPCPGIDVTLSAGLASGSTFPMGNTQVCYTAQDVCGQTKSCCFNVSVAEESPCDIKVNGCMKYELLTITEDQLKKKTYRIRVTNNCASEMIYTAIQVPSGLVATFPLNNTIYAAPGGNDYMVRNPNYNPFYSVRYSSQGVGIANGESDILRYTLPPLASVTYIHIMSRVFPLQTFEAHLNTFYCPVGVTPLDQRSDEPSYSAPTDQAPMVVFPNPTDGSINVDLAAWEGENVQLRVFNSQGQQVLLNNTTATYEPYRIDLSQSIADGLYILEVSTGGGENAVVKFVVKH